MLTESFKAQATDQKSAPCLDYAEGAIFAPHSLERPRSGFPSGPPRDRLVSAASGGPTPASPRQVGRPLPTTFRSLRYGRPIPGVFFTFPMFGGVC